MFAELMEDEEELLSSVDEGEGPGGRIHHKEVEWVLPSACNHVTQEY